MADAGESTSAALARRVFIVFDEEPTEPTSAIADPPVDYGDLVRSIEVKRTRLAAQLRSDGHEHDVALSPATGFNLLYANANDEGVRCLSEIEGVAAVVDAEAMPNFEIAAGDST